MTRLLAPAEQGHELAASAVASVVSGFGRSRKARGFGFGSDLGI